MSEPSHLQFIDTNILIYAHDRSAGDKHVRARDLLRGLWQSGEGCLSIQVLQEFYVNVTQKVAKPLAPAVASRLQQRYQISFWDAMIVASAIQLRCQSIWSEDLNPGQDYGGVRVVNPF